MPEPMHTDPAGSAKKQMAALESSLAPIFAKAPHLPKEARNVLVLIAPWLSLIFGVLGVLAILSLVGMSPVWMAYGPGYGMNSVFGTIALLVSLVASILQIMAWKPLSERKKKGWNYLFYATVLTTLLGLLEIFFGGLNLGSIIGAIIGFWLLFEIRGAYHA